MLYYFIDYENVNKNGMHGIATMNEDDDITIFYSEHADTMSFSLHEEMNQSKAAIHFIKVEARLRNALDFQLSSYLGYMIANHPEDTFYIVSKDAGYQSVCQFWQSRNVQVDLIGRLNYVLEKRRADAQKMEDLTVEAPTPVEPVTEPTVTDSQPVEEEMAPVQPEPEQHDEKEEMRQRVADIMGEEVASEITDYLLHYKTKQGINNALVKKYGSTQGGEYYQKLKPLLANKKQGVQPKKEKASTKKASTPAHVETTEQPLDKTESRNKVAAIMGEEMADEITDYLLKYKTKQGFNNALVKKYGSKQGGEYYHQLRSLLKGKKGR